ncbi:MAG: hypothetical protein AAGI51_13650 [Pseudomonadota bacterium]
MTAAPARAMMVDDVFLHQSAITGPSGDIGPVVSGGVYLGSIFELGERHQVTEIGGNFLTPRPTSSLVAGIVEITGNLPDFSPADLAENFLASTLLTLTKTSSEEVSATFQEDVFLDAGRYALIYAGGFGGATGNAQAPQTGQVLSDVSPTLPGSQSGLFFGAVTPQSNPWRPFNLPGVRFFAKGRVSPLEPPPPPPPPPPPGAEVPLPATGWLLISALALGAGWRRRRAGA